MTKNSHKDECKNKGDGSAKEYVNIKRCREVSAMSSRSGGVVHFFKAKQTCQVVRILVAILYFDRISHPVLFLRVAAAEPFWVRRLSSRKAH